MRFKKAIERVRPKMILEFGKPASYMKHLPVPPTEGEKVIVVETHFHEQDPIKRQCVTVKRKCGVQTFVVDHFVFPTKKIA